MRPSESTRSITAHVPAPIHAAVQAAAARNYNSAGAFVRQALSEKLSREGLIPSEGAEVRRVYLNDAAGTEAA